MALTNAIIPQQPSNSTITDSTGRVSTPWSLFFNNLLIVVKQLNAGNQSGTTALRPTVNLYIGMSYFDTTLGLPVFLKTLAPVWVNAAGTVV